MSIQFEGAEYDLTEFSHPGGSIIRGAFHTDATALVHSYHPDVERVRRAIKPYQLEKVGDTTATAAIYKGPLYTELKRRVHDALRQNSKSPGADFWMRFKMAGLVIGYLLSFFWLSFSATRSGALLAACSLGCIGALVGMNVMHDASHMAIETGSSVSWNYVWQLSGDMIGLSTLGWRYQHAMQHHIHTDNGSDPDAAFMYPVMRSDPNQRHLVIHYFQIFFLPPVALSLIVLFQIYDAIHTITGVYTWEGLRKPTGTSHTKREWAQFVLAKLCNLLQWGMLLHKGGFAAWALFCGCGSFILSSIDVPGHFTTRPSLPEKLPPSIEQGDVIDNWLLEQLHHTNSFAQSLNGLCGGLNMQIEHHLFPRFSHRHYPSLRPIIQEFCQEHGLPYYYYSLFGATVATVERVVRYSFPPKSKLA